MGHEQIGADGMRLLTAVDAETTEFGWLRAVPALRTLRWVWIQQYQLDSAGAVRWRQGENVPPAARMINSPYDVEARYSTKRSTTWIGFKAHLTEACDPERPHLITNVETTLAPTPDRAMTDPIQADLVEVSAGAASLHVTGIGNARARRFVFQGGVGETTLDFSGGWNASATASIQMGMGAVTLRFPRSLGVRLSRSSFLTSFDAEGLVRRGDSYFSENWESAPNQLTLEVEAARHHRAGCAMPVRKSVPRPPDPRQPHSPTRPPGGRRFSRP